MSLYEHVYLARQDASAQQVEELTAHLKSVVEGLGGSVAKTEYWGVKSLSYRLRIFRQRQRLRGAVPHRLAELLAERSIDFLEHLPRRRKSFGQGFAHADRLTALAGKYESRCHPLPLKVGRKIPGVRRCQGRRRPRFRSADALAFRGGMPITLAFRSTPAGG